MIYSTPPLPFSSTDSEKSSPVRITAPPQGKDFMSLLTQAVARVGARTGETRPSSAASGTQGSSVNEVSAPQKNTMKDALRIVMNYEGSRYVAKDGGKESSKFGILQQTAEKYGYQGSVKDMSRAQAEAIYAKIWNESGAEDLPPNLALVHFDTYVNSPAAARKMLKASKGDTETYLQLRTQRYTRLSKLKPQTFGKYMKGWMNRINSLRTLVAQNTNAPSTRTST